MRLSEGEGGRADDEMNAGRLHQDATDGNAGKRKRKKRFEMRVESQKRRDGDAHKKEKKEPVKEEIIGP